MAFCSNCGKQLKDGILFCGNCGNKVPVINNTNNTVDRNSNNNSAGFVNNQQVADTIYKTDTVMVLSVTQKDGFFKVKQGYLVFFNDRVIFAVVNQKRQQQEIQLLREKLKAEGKGFFKGTAEIMRFWSNYGNKYYQMPAQSVLNDDPENIEMYYPGISLFHFVSARTQNNVDNTNSESYGKIIIHMGGNKIKFNHRYHDYNKKIKGILTGIFANRLKYRGQIGIHINIGGNKDGFN